VETYPSDPRPLRDETKFPLVTSPVPPPPETAALSTSKVPLLIVKYPGTPVKGSNRFIEDAATAVVLRNEVATPPVPMMVVVEPT
jgi:hypothetical protein